MEVGALIERDRKMLERLAAEGKPTRILDEELGLAKELERAELFFLAGAYAVITPRGRRLLAALESKPPKPPKPPLAFTS